MGELGKILQKHVDDQLYPVSDRDLARALQTSPTTIGKWKAGKTFPTKENLVAIARLTGAAYLDVLEAALVDSGYKERDGDGNAAPTKTAGRGSAQGLTHAERVELLRAAGLNDRTADALAGEVERDISSVRPDEGGGAGVGARPA
jgi:transcriptional regulator with XRE-family HTH domain